MVAATETKNSTNVMIVFDASGSMWGQIDGVTKVEIARDAFSAAETVWSNDDRNVGLLAYGHRRKGDCSDIETLVPLGANTGETIAKTVQNLRPKGKTPLTDALRLAARELRYREEAASVVLFSDGIESCNADPCALAQELEQDGIDFTAHVIGFGLGETTDRAQLECIAANTGGKFLEAQDAPSLKDALIRIAETPKPEPAREEAVKTVSLRVTLAEEEGTVRPDQVTLRATEVTTGEKRLLGKLQGADQVISGVQVDLPIGEWTIAAISEEGAGEQQVKITPDTQQVEIPFKANAADFKLVANGPYRLGVEHTVLLDVADPLQANAQYTVALFPAGATEYDQRLDWETRFGSDNARFTEHSFAPPEAPGAYEVIVLRGYDLSAANARFPIAFAQDAPIRWLGKRRGEPGEQIKIRISGDTYRNNNLALRTADGTDVISQWLQDYGTPDKGLVMDLPKTAGVYELFYNATSEESEISLGKITVGNVILEDDPDTVAPPEGQSQATTSQTKAPNVDIVFRCDQPMCLYNNEGFGIRDVPVHQGFGVAHEVSDDDGRPSFDVVNLESGNVIIVNPTFMVNTMECYAVTENGRNSGLKQDTLCMSQDAGGKTVAQFESLERWVATKNAAALNAELAKDREAHDATMGEDTLYTTSSLNGGWSLRDQQTNSIVAIVALDTAGEGEVNLDVLVYRGEQTGFKDGAKHYALPAQPMTDNTTELLGLNADSDEVTLQLRRPQNWNGEENFFSGFITLKKTGKTIEVEMF